MCERSVKPHCFARYPFLFFFRHCIKRHHVVKTVKQLYRDYPDVVFGKSDELFKCDRLLFLLCQFHFCKFCNPFNKICDRTAEHGLDLLYGRGRVFNCVMKKPCNDTVRIHSHFCKKICNGIRVKNIRFTVLSHNSFMG